MANTQRNQNLTIAVKTTMRVQARSKRKPTSGPPCSKRSRRRVKRPRRPPRSDQINIFYSFLQIESLIPSKMNHKYLKDSSLAKVIRQFDEGMLYL
jgi:hypothetical protein